MTITEKITAYFDELVARKLLRPGDKLPGYMEICKQFSIPYSSAQRAFKNMEYAGKIKIVHGVGSFLNGGNELEVLVYLTKTTFDLQQMEELLTHLSQANNLHLKIRVIDIKSPDYKTDVEDHKIIISEKDPWIKTDGTLLDFSSFQDYGDLIQQHHIPSEKYSNTELPFYMFTYQGLVNTRIQERLNISLPSGFSSFDWWTDVAECCRRHGVYPSSFSLQSEVLWGGLATYLPLFLILSGRNNFSNLFDAPFFSTEKGKRMFEILADFKRFHEGCNPFLQKDVLLHFLVGSWTAVQYEKFGWDASDFHTVPIVSQGKRLLFYSPVFLQVYQNSSITQNEKERVWTLLKLLLSKKIMKKLVEKTGFFSFRKDMSPEDYPWIVKNDFRDFFPFQCDQLLPTEYLSTEKSAALNALFQAYWDCGADFEKIRTLMDQKIVCQPPCGGLK